MRNPRNPSNEHNRLIETPARNAERAATGLKKRNTLNKGGKRDNAGRKRGKTGLSKPYAVSLSETQRNWLKSEYGSLTKAIKKLLPENIL